MRCESPAVESSNRRVMKCSAARTRVPRRRRAAGFSFIEVMVAVVIIGLLTGAVALKVVSNVDKARKNRAKSDIQNIVTALETHQLYTGALPPAQPGLTALKDISHFNDPWDRPYEYFRTGAEFEVVSYGRDGREGGEGPDADISSRDLGKDSLDDAG